VIAFLDALHSLQGKLDSPWKFVPLRLGSRSAAGRTVYHSGAENSAALQKTKWPFADGLACSGRLNRHPANAPNGARTVPWIS
jgi:hypothetical protein